MQWFLWHLRMGVDGTALLLSLLFTTPAGWLLLLAWGAASMLGAQERVRPDARWLLLLWPVVTSISVIVVGATFANAGSDVDADIIGSAWFVHLAGVAAIVAVLRGMRWVAVTVLSAGTLLFAGFSFAASMAISGVWL